MNDAWTNAMSHVLGDTRFLAVNHSSPAGWRNIVRYTTNRATTLPVSNRGSDADASLGWSWDLIHGDTITYTTRVNTAFALHYQSHQVTGNVWKRSRVVKSPVQPVEVIGDKFISYKAKSNMPGWQTIARHNVWQLDIQQKSECTLDDKITERTANLHQEANTNKSASQPICVRTLDIHSSRISNQVTMPAWPI